MKRKQSSKTKKARIHDVYNLAYTNKKFLNALLKDSDKALARFHIMLGDADRKSLRKILNKKINIKSDELMKYLNRFYDNVMRDKEPPPPPPPPWEEDLLLRVKTK